MSSLYILLAIAIVLLVLGLILRRRYKLGNTINSMRTVSWILISIGVLGIIAFVVTILAVSGVFGPPASQLRINEGKELHEQGRLEEAIDKYTEAIRIEPEYKGAYQLRGIAYCDLGQYELGIEDFNEGIRFGYRGEKYYRRGLAYAELGRKVKAIADFEKFISLTDDPERAEAAREEIEELSKEMVEEEEEPAFETVTFPDENLEAAVRDALGKPVGEEISVAELAGLTALQAEDSGIADLSGLEYCTNLTELGLWGNQISEIAPLSNLTSLTWLSLEHNEISDISPLSNLTNLTELWLWNNQISDISPLVNLTSLTWLKLVGNQISDISPLVDNSGLGEGDEVVLAGNNLDLREGSEDMKNIKALEDRGVEVHY